MRITRVAVVFPIVLGLFGTAAWAEQAVLEFDPGRTHVAFTLPSLLHTVHGTFRLKRGTIRFDTSTGAASGELVVDAQSGESGSTARDNRMHKSILESARYPEIKFTPDRVSGAVNLEGASTVQVHGSFEIHGAVHEITLPVQAQGGNGQMTAKLGFQVPYVKWGMKNPSTFVLRVNDTVEIEIEAVGRLSHL